MVVFIILIALILAAPYVYQMFRKDNIINFNEFDKAVALLSKGKKVSRGNSWANDRKWRMPNCLPSIRMNYPMPAGKN
jgi:competence protein ComEA